jgi:hypothetical protein
MPSSTVNVVHGAGESEDVTKIERRRKRKPPPEPEHTLLAAVKSVTVSYFVQRLGDSVADEAITDVLAEIVSIEPKMPQHIGKEVTCHLMCSRTYREDGIHTQPAGAGQCIVKALFRPSTAASAREAQACRFEERHRSDTRRSRGRTRG